MRDCGSGLLARTVTRGNHVTFYASSSRPLDGPKSARSRLIERHPSIDPVLIYLISSRLLQDLLRTADPGFRSMVLILIMFLFRQLRAPI
jgi:hypothetical protein